MAKKKISERGAKVARTRKEHAEFRNRLAEMTPQQLRNFFKAFDESAFGRIEASLARVTQDRVEDTISSKLQEIEQLQAEVSSLKSNA